VTNYTRFKRAVKEWEAEIIAQCRRRAVVTFPSIEEFIVARRLTIGQFAVERKFPSTPDEI
jgi:hypothetical protein